MPRGSSTPAIDVTEVERIRRISQYGVGTWPSPCYSAIASELPRNVMQCDAARDDVGAFAVGTYYVKKQNASSGLSLSLGVYSATEDVVPYDDATLTASRKQAFKKASSVADLKSCMLSSSPVSICASISFDNLYAFHLDG